MLAPGGAVRSDGLASPAMSPPRRAPAPRSIGAPARGLVVATALDAVLRSAFGAVEASAAVVPDPDAFIEMASRTGLLPRIVHRLGPERLSSRLGSRGARRALQSYRGSALASARLVSLARLVGRVAAEAGIRVVALKHVALCLSGVASAAARGAVDADLLVAGEDASRLVDALVRTGLHTSNGPSNDHQLSPLYHAQGGMLELHRKVPGVRPSVGERELGLEALVRLDLAVPADAATPFLLVPRPPVLLAHALAHALYQHGPEPGAYAPFKLLADSADLRAASGDGLLSEALPLVAAEVNADDARAAWELPVLLGASGVEAVFAYPESPEARLLAHFVRGAFEPAYAQSLKLRSVATPRAGRGPVSGLLRNAWNALAIGPAQAHALYGADTRAKYLLALALRPFHLAVKLVRYAAAALRR